MTNNFNHSILKKPLEGAFRIFFSSRQRSFLFAVTLFALIIRLGIIVFAAHPQRIMDDPQHSLLYEHGVIAHNLYTGHGFAMHWPYVSFDSVRVAAMKLPPKWEGAAVAPLNPYLLYLSYEIFGESTNALYAMMIFYALVTAFIPFVVFKLSLFLGDEHGARISSTLAVLFLPGAYAVATFSGSALFQFLGVVILYFTVRSIVQPTWKSFLWLGVSSGIMINLRGEFTFFGPLLIAVSFMLAARKKFHFSLVIQAAASVVICFCIVAPWTIRNYRVFHEFIPTVSHHWSDLWRGNNDLTEGTNRRSNGEAIWVNPSDFPQLVHRMDSIPYDRNFEGKVDLVFKTEVMNFVEAHPAKFIALAGKKVFYFFTIDPNDPLSSNLFYWGPTLILSLLIVIGLIKIIRDSTKWEVGLPFILFLGYYLSMTALTLMQSRYQIYVFTCMLPVTGLAVYRTPNSSATHAP